MSRNDDQDPTLDFINKIRSLADKIFTTSNDDPRGYVVSSDYIPTLLEILFARSRDPPGSIDYDYAAPVARWTAFEEAKLNILLDWLLREHPEYAKIYTAHFFGFSLREETLFILNRPFYEVINLGCGIEFVDSSEDEAPTTVLLAKYWVDADFQELVNLFFTVEKEERDHVLSYIQAAIESHPPYYGDLFLFILRFSEYTGTNILNREDLQYLFDNLPWWRYRLRPQLQVETNFGLQLHDVFWTKDGKENYVGPLLMPIVGFRQKTIDAKLLKRFGRDVPLPRIPLFEQTDRCHYPRCFFPTMRILLLVWYRWKMPKDIVRSILPNFVLWNAFQQINPLVVTMEQNFLKVTEEVSDVDCSQRLLSAGISPNNRNLNGGRLGIDNYTYALLGSGIPVVPDKEAYDIHVGRNLAIYNPGASSASSYKMVEELQLMPKEEIIDRFRAGTWVLSQIPSQTDGRYRTAYFVLSSIGTLCTYEEVASWIKLQGTTS